MKPKAERNILCTIYQTFLTRHKRLLLKLEYNATALFLPQLNCYFDYVLMQCRTSNQAVMKRITIFKNGTPAEGRVSNYKLYIAFHIMFLFNFHHRGLLLFTLFIFVPFHRPSMRFKVRNPLVCLASWQIRMHNKLNIPHFTLQILQ